MRDGSNLETELRELKQQYDELQQKYNNQLEQTSRALEQKEQLLLEEHACQADLRHKLNDVLNQSDAKLNSQIDLSNSELNEMRQQHADLQAKYNQLLEQAAPAKVLEENAHLKEQCQTLAESLQQVHDQMLQLESARGCGCCAVAAIVLLSTLLVFTLSVLVWMWKHE